MEQTFMHESARGLSLWTCGQAKGLSSPGCHQIQWPRSQGHSGSPRHQSCPVPDKRMKYSWCVFTTMGGSTLFSYGGFPTPFFLTPLCSSPLHIHRHICWPTWWRLQVKTWTQYWVITIGFCRGRTGISFSLLCIWPLKISQIKSLIIYEG